MHCNECNCYQLAFGVLVLNMQCDEFIQLDAYVEYHRYGLPSPEDENRKQIQLPLFSNHSLMVLTYTELRILSQLFEHAKACEETEKLLEELSIRKQDDQ